MITAIDTNILMDIILPDLSHVATSKTLLDSVYQEGALIINEVVYAELASQFPSQDSLDELLGRTSIRLEQSQREALHAASQAWLVYKGRRSLGLQCPQCGHIRSVTCPSCGNSISPRQHILADFLIGGHAVTHADRLLTRDRGYFRTYFPALQLKEEL